MGKLAEKVEEAFKKFDHGDLPGFTSILIDTADYNVQSKKARESLDSFVLEHFKNRKEVLEDFSKLTNKKNRGGKAVLS